ncbi:ABC transporter ATP-binding protein [Candidatus Contendibacter odensensis]|uniref:ABC transporter domain-containing protein n=1 Tax=Candidatus Contendobacter odensis Run_B_J11 TaxID=1400861 RepID=A0A7U7G7F3_9GAMM|nr:polysaccharide ABC transporter ATP-binding protein [Candidatus Contendobacter odensis]CDH43062.1 conserved hypothetical protein [Candidatus Contendobacter odensis Run_B_J11]
MSDTLIKVEGVSKKFCRSLKRSLWYGLQDLGSELRGRRHGGNGELRPDEFWAVQEVSFELKRGECLGLIGPNGAGKTTLLRMLNGLIKPDQGRIEMVGRIGALIALGAGFNPILTGRENIYVNASILGFSRSDVDRLFDEIIAFSGVGDFIDTPVQNYSSGMTVRLGFAVAAYMQPDILLVDEVLAVGDEGFQVKCLNKIGDLRKNGTVIILVSHNMHTISTYSDLILLKTREQALWFSDVGEGVTAYKQLFFDLSDNDIEKHCTGNEGIRILDVKVPTEKLRPGDNVTVEITYHAESALEDIEVDTAIRTSSESGFHFQATNRTYDRKLDLPRGEGRLLICIESVRVNSMGGKLIIAIWQKDRSALFFWWRIPIQFESMPASTGSCFYDVGYNVQ